MSETRSIKAELKQDGNKLVGYAAVWDTPTEIYERGRRFTEVIRRGAFQRAISEAQDTVLNVDHDDSRLLARTQSGTLKLSEDIHGLRVEADLPSFAADIRELIQRGDYQGMSFRFVAQKDRWTKDVRELLDVDLEDVAIVVRPAYKQTSVSIRSQNAKLRNELYRKMLND